MIFRFSALLAVSAFVMTALAPAQAAEEADASLQRAFEALEASGMSVIVGVASTRSEEQTIADFGRLRDDGIPAADTQVDLLSVTKSVTAVAILKLVEDGLLRLDEALGDIFPDAPGDKSAITVHQLLTHSAGLSSLSGDDFEPVGRDDVLRRVFATPLIYTPGEQYSYSNTGYSLLAAIVEVRSGQTFDAYLADLLRPHGIGSFGYETVYDPDRAVRSERGGRVREESWGGDRAWWNLRGGGGLIATAEDFLTFRRLLASGEILSPEYAALAAAPHIREYENRDSFYGYGLVVEDTPGHGVVIGHNGGSRFFSSEWIEYTGTGDILFTAGPFTSQGNAFRAMRLLREHLYPESGGE